MVKGDALASLFLYVSSNKAATLFNTRVFQNVFLLTKEFNMKLLYFIFALSFSVNFYSQETIKIEEVTNNIVMGPFAGDRNLAFGVKNILEEVVQDRDYYLDDNAPKSIKVELLYFDVKKNSAQFAVYGRKVDITQIAAGARLIIDGEVVKEVNAKASSKSISTSTLIIDDGGKFSQAAVSSALKKVCEQLIDKLKL